MHVFMPFVANAKRGGLHAHVEALARLLVGSGHRCTVMCRPCPSVTTLRDMQVEVLETDFADVHTAVAAAIEHSSYDLVHAHPFLSREVGLRVARQLQVPMILTVHGMQADDIETWIDDVGLVLCVSAAIRDFLVESCARAASKSLVLPNGVDTSVFHPVDGLPEGLEGASDPPLDAISGNSADRVGPLVLIVTRMHQDKLFIVECLEELFSSVDTIGERRLNFLVVGEGDLEERLRARAQILNSQLKRSAVECRGWQDVEALARLYRMADVAIAPGRSALEAMACGTPVIAIGSKGYVGLVCPDNILTAAHSNFGGVGSKHQGYEAGALMRDLGRALDLELTARSTTRDAYAGVIDWLFDQDTINQAALHAYSLAFAQRPPALLQPDQAVEPPASQHWLWRLLHR